LIVVVQVLVAERDPENPLADERGDLVLGCFELHIRPITFWDSPR
jgi:hypothetical protein